jgi:hypothetical protein
LLDGRGFLAGDPVDSEDEYGIVLPVVLSSKLFHLRGESLLAIGVIVIGCRCCTMMLLLSRLSLLLLFAMKLDDNVSGGSSVSTDNAW